MSEGPRPEEAMCVRWWPRAQPSPAAVGEGGQEASFKANNGGEGRGVRDLLPTEAEPESWASLACLAPGFACLSLPDLIASPRRWSGAVGLVHTGRAHSKGAVPGVQASTALLAVGSGRECSWPIPAFLLPLSWSRTPCAHTIGM